MKVTITKIRNNNDMTILLKQRLEEARRNCEPLVIEKNGYRVFRKTNSGRKSLVESYLEEKYSYDSEEEPF